MKYKYTISRRSEFPPITFYIYIYIVLSSPTYFGLINAPRAVDMDRGMSTGFTDYARASRIFGPGHCEECYVLGGEVSSYKCLCIA